MNYGLRVAAVANEERHRPTEERRQQCREEGAPPSAHPRDYQWVFASLRERIRQCPRHESRAVLAADILQRMGYTNVSSLRGGFRDWAMGGGAVEE